jgi:SpoVK/Ycf46/Vps4 family AAA+-type ATPase
MPDSPTRDNSLVLPQDDVEIDTLLRQIEEGSRNTTGNYCMLLVGGDHDAKLRFGERIAREKKWHFIKVDMSVVMEQRAPETIANLRETFDTATKSLNVLYLDDLGVLVEDSTPAADDESNAVKREIDAELHYLCLRAKAYDGLTVMSVDEMDQASDRLCEDIVNVVITFEEDQDAPAGRAAA